MVEQTSVSCCTCGCLFFMPVRFNEALRRSGKTFYCPSGHAQSYTSEVETLRKRIEALTYERDRAIQNRDHWQKFAEQPRYRCCVAGCDFWRSTKAALRRHLETEHHFVDTTVRRLPAEAGPSN